ncbi:RICIN domain-containing protein [Plantactinospora solaniradicis]|uniref:RICIN domain-containing protein n=1 Tax=Plantactinospora solaniradicis TaxID=1723736 RepID=A0ABW1KAA9_9ACTN
MPRYETPWQDEPGRSPGGTVYGRRNRRLPHDPLLFAAFTVGGAGVLLGVLFAAGVFSGNGGRAGPVRVAPAGSPSAGSPVPTPGGSAAGSHPAATPTPTPTPHGTPAGTPGPTGPRLLRSAVSALCLDIVGTEVAEGADVHQVPCGAGASQRWLPTPVGGDVFALVNAASSKCLDVDGASLADGAPVQQWSCTGQPDQRWRLVRTAAGTTMLVSVHSGKCLDLPAANLAPGIRMRQFSCQATPNQQWIEQRPD